MTSRSRLLLILTLAGFWIWGAFVASVDEQEALSRFLREAIDVAPELPARLGQYARFLFSGLLS